MDIRPLDLFLPISKWTESPDGNLLVEARLTDETPDSQGEILRYEGSKRAAAEYAQNPAVREMHQNLAAGTAIRIDCMDDEKAVYGLLKVVDPVAIKKVKEGVYRGVSVGGWKVKSAPELHKGKTMTVVDEWIWNETSLVDRGANPNALFLDKVEGAPQGMSVIGKIYTEAPEVQVEYVDPTTDMDFGPDGKVIKESIMSDDTTELVEKAAETVETTETPAPEATPDVEPVAKAEDHSEPGGDEGKDGKGDGDKDDNEKKDDEDKKDDGKPWEKAEAAPAEDLPVLKVHVGTWIETATTELAKRMVMGHEDDESTAQLRRFQGLLDQVIGRPVDMNKIDGNSGADSNRLAKADLDAVKADVLQALEPMREAIAKIAAMEIPGGPVRFDTDRDDTPESGDSLKKLMNEGNLDAVERDTIGRIIAKQGILNAHRSR